MPVTTMEGKIEAPAARAMTCPSDRAGILLRFARAHAAAADTADIADAADTADAATAPNCTPGIPHVPVLVSFLQSAAAGGAVAGSDVGQVWRVQPCI